VRNNIDYLLTATEERHQKLSRKGGFTDIRMSVKDNYLKFFKPETEDQKPAEKKKETGEAFEISPALGVRGDQIDTSVPKHSIDKNLSENDYFK